MARFLAIRTAGSMPIVEERRPWRVLANGNPLFQLAALVDDPGDVLL
jgi:hypothetical protein